VTVSSTVLNVYHSPWAKVGYGSTYGQGTSFVGVTGQDVATLNYAWFQTWGPCACTPADFYGAGVSERQVVFASDGAITLSTSSTTEMAYQHAGFLIPNTYYNGGLVDLADGGHLVFLQIAP
jgi:hypothetical protein